MKSNSFLDLTHNFVYVVKLEAYENETSDELETFIEAIYGSWDKAESFIRGTEDIGPMEMEYYTSSYLYPNRAKSSECFTIMRPVWHFNNLQKDCFYIEIWDVYTGTQVPYDSEHIHKEDIPMRKMSKIDLSDE